MQDVIADVGRWRSQGVAVALATVVQTWGSAPRKVGAKMAISAGGQLSGSVSGGCVEGAVAEQALAVLDSGRPRLLSYGVPDETSWQVGLACGGNIQIFVETLDGEIYAAEERLLIDEGAGATVTVIAGPDVLLGRKLFVDSRGNQVGGIDAAIDGAAAKLAGEAIRSGSARRVLLEHRGIDLFVDVWLPPPSLIMIGGVHIAIALAKIAEAVGYRTIVVDPRHAFGSAARFPHVDQLVQKWPEDAFGDIVLNENTAVALLTHDPKIDDPALEIVLRSRAFYIGALGSQMTHTQRIKRLQDNGLGGQDLGGIRGPIGLDIDAQTPEEIALSIMAEIVKVRRG